MSLPKITWIAWKHCTACRVGWYWPVTSLIFLSGTNSLENLLENLPRKFSIPRKPFMVSLSSGICIWRIGSIFFGSGLSLSLDHLCPKNDIFQSFNWSFSPFSLRWSLLVLCLVVFFDVKAHGWTCKLSKSLENICMFCEYPLLGKWTMATDCWNVGGCWLGMTWLVMLWTDSCVLFLLLELTFK